MLPRARQTEAEDGFILIEVLVSALILAIVAGAVLALITATTHSAASERAHSVAYGLAQEDQARLRSMRLASLNEKNELRPNVEVGGTKYEVRSQGRFVNNTSGTRSCSSENASTDYVEITSTVSSPAMANPVSLHSVVSPTSGSLDPSHGSLAIQAMNAEGGPVSGVTATISGPTNGSASTREEGCAIFADIPAGVYKLTISAHGLVNREGKTSEELPTVSVPPSGTAQVPVYYDLPGKILPTFVYAEPGKAELQPAAIDSMMVFNSDSGKPATMYGSPGTYPPTPALKVEGVYPFAAPYSVYAGSCAKDQPVAPSPAIPKVPVAPGATTTPSVQVPVLDAQVTYNGVKQSAATVTLTDTKCPETGAKVMRTLTTNANGHVAMTTTSTAEAIGLPWSTYKVCVSKKVTNSKGKTEYRKFEIPTLAIETVEGPVTPSLDLSGTGSTGSSESSYHC
jgi:type II secretory pathway pseudopilin PulG